MVGSLTAAEQEETLDINYPTNAFCCIRLKLYCYTQGEMGKSPDLCIYKNKWGYLFFMAKKITQAYVAVVTQEDQ